MVAGRKKLILFFSVSCCLSLLLSNCYLLEQGYYLLSYQLKTEDIETVLQRDGLPEDTREMLLLAQEIKQFAVSEIGLKDDRNFSRYLDIQKDYVADVVSASEKDQFLPYRWDYPIFGTFPYKGFFEKKNALLEARRLSDNDMDVYVRQVDAFSTLGFFVDPLYRFMSGYSTYALSNLIIHEQTHTTIFLKDQINFNEELATFIGIEGALLFMRAKFGEESKQHQEVLRYLDDLDMFISQIRRLHEILDTMYRQNTSRDDKMVRREQIFSDFHRNFLATYPQLYKTQSFRDLLGSEINNALILSYMRYTKDLSLYYDVYRACDGDLHNLITFLAALVESGTRNFLADPKTYLAAWLSSGSTRGF